MTRLTRGVVASIVVMAALTTSVGSATGQSTVRLSHSGDCPNIKNVRNALKAEAIAVDRKAGLTAQIVSGNGDAYVSIQQEDELLASRRITSSDCAALAETFALIIAHAVRDWTASSAASNVEPESNEKKLSESGSIESPRAGNELPAVLLRPYLPRTPAVKRSVSVTSSVGVAAASEGSSRAVVSLDANVCKPWCLGVALHVTQKRQFETIRSRQISLGATAGREWTYSEARIRATAGVAWVLNHLTSKEIENEIRSQPAAAIAAIVAVPVTPYLSLNAKVSAFVSLETENYRLDSETQGASPRFQVLTNLGIEFWTNW